MRRVHQWARFPAPAQLFDNFPELPPHVSSQMESTMIGAFHAPADVPSHTSSSSKRISRPIFAPAEVPPTRPSTS